MGGGSAYLRKPVPALIPKASLQPGGI